jgi:capsid portal protein
MKSKYPDTYDYMQLLAFCSKSSLTQLIPEEINIATERFLKEREESLGGIFTDLRAEHTTEAKKVRDFLLRMYFKKHKETIEEIFEEAVEDYRKEHRGLPHIETEHDEWRRHDNLERLRNIT